VVRAGKPASKEGKRSVPTFTSASPGAQGRGAIEVVVAPEIGGCDNMSAGDFAAWLAANPAPDLQDFIRQHGDWRRLPPEVWASFAPEQQANIKANGSHRAVAPAEWAIWDRLVADWQAGRRARMAAREP
jgi:hypothetical protein